MLYQFDKQHKLVEFMQLGLQMGFKCTVKADLLVDIPPDMKAFAEFYGGKSLSPSEPSSEPPSEPLMPFDVENSIGLQPSEKRAENGQEKVN